MVLDLGHAYVVWGVLLICELKDVLCLFYILWQQESVLLRSSWNSCLSLWHICGFPFLWWAVFVLSAIVSNSSYLYDLWTTCMFTVSSCDYVEKLDGHVEHDYIFRWCCICGYQSWTNTLGVSFFPHVHPPSGRICLLALMSRAKLLAGSVVYYLCVQMFDLACTKAGPCP